MDLLFYALAAVAALVLGAFVNHHLERSKNPKANAVAARADAIFDQVDAEIAKGAPAIAEDVKTAIERALKAIADAEAKAQADVEAAIKRQEAVRAGNAQAVATIQQAAAPIVAPPAPEQAA